MVIPITICDALFFRIYLDQSYSGVKMCDVKSSRYTTANRGNRGGYTLV